ncbi:hypothetical protein B0T25DRAFT_550015 [Lasiosphaeria hispida]|uniref:Uncharacterized protein n=1 Tax=Lasiosphaeria hispida TaxID=260671 RepID=A0AAJ0MD16_9PEZI|nr:hypothetical protein B0T25DRAFT_550015 [Lasiosphaeria hispida]
MSRFSTHILWLTGFTAVSLVANFISLLGCISPATKDFPPYRVNATPLADGLQKQAYNGTRDAAELRKPICPGTGACRAYATSIT